jgi:VanZ family protein
VVAWLLALGWMAVIFTLSAQPSFPLHTETVLDIVLRKLGHFLEYALLGILLFRALAATGIQGRPAHLWALALAVSYAISDELHQAFTPQRTPSTIDVGIDVLGATIGVFAWRTWLQHREIRGG